MEAALRKLAENQISRVQNKWTPRRSGSGHAHVALNSLVPVAMSLEDGGVARDTVQSRHFALAFTKHAGKKSELMAQFSAVSTIKTTFHGDLTRTHREFKEVIDSPIHHRVYLENRQLGPYMATLARQLDTRYPRETTSGEAHVNCLLLTDCHAMAVHLQRKCKSGVTYFAAKVYDPETTASYMRIESLHPEGLMNVTLSDMLIDKRNRPGAFVAICLNDELAPDIKERVLSPSPESMAVALFFDRTDAVKQMFQAAEHDSPRAFAGLLSEFHKTTGCSVLGAAFLFGRTEAVLLAIDTVLHSRLHPHQKTNLLMAMSRNGDTGLFGAFKHGSTDMVQAVTNRVLAAPQIDAKSKLLVLTAWSSTQRCPGLHEAFRTGQTDKVAVFTQSVLASPSLDESSKVGLLLAASAMNGTSGLSAALVARHTQTVATFMALVEQSNLSLQGKSQLVGAPYRLARANGFA